MKSTFNDIDSKMDTYYYNSTTKLRRYAIFVTSVSLLTTTILTMASVIVAIISHSAATTAFAANSAIDLISCCIVFWRYYDVSTYTANSHQTSKEKKTCVFLGSLFIISALAVIGKAIYDLIFHSITTKIDELILLSTIAIFLCIMLSGLKFWLYLEMLCASIYHDAISSIINLMFAILIIFSSEMIRFNEQFWWLDPCGSFVLAIGMIIYGFYVIISANMYREPQKQPWTYTTLA